jgi:hypothetical protein
LIAARQVIVTMQVAHHWQGGGDNRAQQDDLEGNLDDATLDRVMQLSMSADRPPCGDR